MFMSISLWQCLCVCSIVCWHCVFRFCRKPLYWAAVHSRTSRPALRSRLVQERRTAPSAAPTPHLAPARTAAPAARALSKEVQHTHMYCIWRLFRIPTAAAAVVNTKEITTNFHYKFPLIVQCSYWTQLNGVLLSCNSYVSLQFLLFCAISLAC